MKAFVLLTACLLGGVWGQQPAFQAEIDLTELCNPDGLLANGQHCDVTDQFGVHCNLKTLICIESLDDTDTNLYSCRTGSFKDSSIYESDTNCVFIQKGYYDNWFVPYTFSYLGMYYGIRMKVRVMDSNFGFGKDSLVDAFYVDVTDPIGTANKVYDINHPRGNGLQPVEFKFTYGVNCDGQTNCNGMTTAPTTPTTPAPTTQPPCQLSTQYIDFIETTDASQNMGSSNYAAVRNFLINSFFPQFTIGQHSNQMSVSTGFYANSANSWLLWYEQDYSHVVSNLQSWSYVGGSAAVMDQAISDMVIVQTGRGDRSGAKQVAVIFGPGSNTGSAQTALSKANQLRNNGVTVLAIGLGSSSLNGNFLSQLAGGSQNVLQLTSSNQLATTALTWLNNKICNL